MMNLGDVAEEGRAEDDADCAAARRRACLHAHLHPAQVHAAIGVLGAVSVATAAALHGSIVQGIARVPDGTVKRVSVEHPSGEFTVDLEVREFDRGFEVLRSSLVRTARALFTGHVLVPGRSGMIRRPPARGR